jgi:uncharacterized membrane protein YsdA (DUF1294 family)/cold shock CspA family protein
MRYRGKLINWKDDKGFGFISPNRGGKQVFVHIKSFVNRQRRPVGNEMLTYEIKTDPKGREQAESVLFRGEQLPSTPSSLERSVPFMVAGTFITIVTMLALMGKLPWVILAFYLTASVVTFVAYSIDKSAARNDQWRIQESTLHLFAVIGGWLGALAAQRLLHHKSKKQSFQIVFWATVTINCGLLGWLFTPRGTAALQYLRLSL